MSLRASNQQPPAVYVKCDSAVNQTRHVESVTCATRSARGIASPYARSAHGA